VGESKRGHLEICWSETSIPQTGSVDRSNAEGGGGEIRYSGKKRGGMNRCSSGNACTGGRWSCFDTYDLGSGRNQTIRPCTKKPNRRHRLSSWTNGRGGGGNNSLATERGRSIFRGSLLSSRRFFLAKDRGVRISLTEVEGAGATGTLSY